jgi:hypothetical protein
MSLFRLKENRYIDTDHIADIEYSPENSLALVAPSVPGSESNPDIPLSSNPSYLNIDLKSAEHIRLEGEEADVAWAAFQAAAQLPLK